MAVGNGGALYTPPLNQESIRRAQHRLAPRSAHRRLESSPKHAFPVQGHLLRIHHGGEARILHDLRQNSIPIFSRSVDNPGKPYSLVFLEQDTLREGSELPLLHI